MRSISKLFLCLAAAACGAPDVRETPGGAEGESATSTAPDTLRDTISLEGMPEPILLRRFETPESFPLRFSTYVPADMDREMDPVSAGEAGAGLRFVAAFGGTRNADAFVHVYAYPEATDLAEVQATARAFIASRGVPVSGSAEPPGLGPQANRRFGWSVHEEGYRYQISDGQWVVGTLALGQHAGRYFHVVTQYPAEYGDGFGPRAARIFEHWQWTDTGRPLDEEARAPGSSGV